MASVNSWAGLLDKYALPLVVLAAGIFAYFKFRKPPPELSELEQQGRAQHAAHLARPTAPGPGATSAQQREYQADMRQYIIAVAAGGLDTALSGDHFEWRWDRISRVKSILDQCAKQKISLRELSTEFKLLQPDKVLTTELQTLLDNSDYRAYLSKLPK